MARANRHHIPGQIWHITHRCHKKEFLLKFAKDRKRWLHWLFEAKKRFGLQILNYMVTSNHIHLLVVDGDKEVIPKSLQLVAGKTAQAFNRRKNRKGAYWEDRYHATAVETGDHLARCLVYIDLNMVRSRVVDHPSQWLFSGYNEIQNPPLRYAMIDWGELRAQLNIRDDEQLRCVYRQWIEDALAKGLRTRQPEWTESIAVGSRAFVEGIKKKLEPRAKGRKITEASTHYELREPSSAYNAHFGQENEVLSTNNTFYRHKEKDFGFIGYKIPCL